MATKQHFEAEPLIPTTAYIWRGVFWVPHYLHEGLYVAPGGVKAHGWYLDSVGARKTVLQLWPRLIKRN